MDIHDFISARLAEDEAGGPSERDRREIAAKRTIINEYSAGYDPTTNYMTLRVAGQTIGQLPPAAMICAVASVYRDHPDFESAWAERAGREFNRP